MYKGKIIADWGKVDLRTPEGVKNFKGAFNHFFKAPDRELKLKAALQHFATKGDFPAEVLQILEKFHATPSYDLGYEQIFDIRDYVGTKESGFELLDVSSGLTFAKIPTGGKAKVFKFTGDKTTVYFDRYGGGLEWDKTLFDDGKYWTLEDNAIAFRNKAYSSRAQAFYDLIDAVSSTKNIAWQAATPSSVATSNENYNAIRDINTINASCLAILKALKDDGVGATPNSPFIILAPVDLKSRISRALGLVQQAYAGSERHLAYTITPIWTLMLSATDKFYVIFPKAKMKGGYRMDLTLLSNTDILAYAETVAGWMRFGGAIGDQDQVRRCSIA
ncbi:MAG: hypothetical protein NTZ48_06850 [Candidatus Omnitrophica bacterium]|nr:hypothetical protein [Candidatus Omnitrophota bacterium]